MSYTVASILPRAAARLHDYNQTNYTNDKLLPFAQDAADVLQLELELYGVLVLEKITTPGAIHVPTGTTNLGVLLPTDMLEPQRLEERLWGATTDLYVEMVRREFTPDLQQTDSLRYWDYREEDIYFVGATTDRDVKIIYLKRLLNVTQVTDVIAVNNSQMFMISMIASFAAKYIGENPTRGQELETEAYTYLRKVTGISSKSKQGTRTRRRPFQIQGRRRWI